MLYMETSMIKKLSIIFTLPLAFVKNYLIILYTHLGSHLKISFRDNSRYFLLKTLSPGSF